MGSISLHALISIVALAVAGAGVAAEPSNDGLPPPPIPKARAQPPADDGLEPEITITTKDGVRHEEYRLNGQLYMVKVTPKRGAPYYLIYDEQGRSRKSDLAPDVVPPSWVIKRF